MERLVIVRFMGTPREGFEFSSSEWPLHLTIVPPFNYDGDIDKLINGLKELLSNQVKVLTTVTGRALFGDKEDITVAILWKSERLGALHSMLVNYLAKKHKVDFSGAKYINGLYNPHVSDQRGKQLKERDHVVITGLSLVAFDSGKLNTGRKVLANFELKNSLK